MLASAAMRAIGTTRVERNGEIIDLTPPWRRCSLQDAIKVATGVDCLTEDREGLLALLGADGFATDSWTDLVNAIYTKFVEPTLIQPTIVYDMPVVGLPLVKGHRADSRLCESFDVVIGGLEVATGDTELNDPDEQRARFDEQSRRLAPGREADPHDADYLRALEHGVAPASGGGVGIERLLMILTGEESIREVIPFPALSGRR